MFSAVHKKILENWIKQNSIGLSSKVVEELRTGVVEDFRAKHNAMGGVWTLEGTSIFNDSPSSICRLRISQFLLETTCGCGQPICAHVLLLGLHAAEAFQVKVSVPKAPVSAPPAAPKPIIKARPGQKRLPDTPLFTKVIELLGQAPESATVEYLHKVENWAKGKGQFIPVEQLGMQDKKARTWGWQTVNLWTDVKPQNEWEVLVLAVMMAREFRLPLPPELDQLVRDEAVEEVRALQKRAQLVKVWEERAKKIEVLHSGRLVKGQPELRLRLVPSKGAVVECRLPGAAQFSKITDSTLRAYLPDIQAGRDEFDLPSRLLVQEVMQNVYGQGGVSFERLPVLLSQLSRVGDFKKHIVSPAGQPLNWQEEPLEWQVLPPAPDAPSYKRGLYEINLLSAQGQIVPKAITILSGKPNYYICQEDAFVIDYYPFSEPLEWPQSVPSEVLHSKSGLKIFKGLGLELPQHLAERIFNVVAQIKIQLWIDNDSYSQDLLRMKMVSHAQGYVRDRILSYGGTWVADSTSTKTQNVDDKIIEINRSMEADAVAWASHFDFRPGLNRVLEYRVISKSFPTQFLQWMDCRPQGIEVELDRELNSLLNGVVSGSVSLDVQESEHGIDWFDLEVKTDISDVSLSKDEIKLLMKAKGQWVRLPDKGWRRLEFEFSEEIAAQLADMGLTTGELAGERQHLHALQLAGKAGAKLLPQDRQEQIKRRVEEIKTRINPPVPGTVQAQLRPYQIEGYHFLAYLSANRFGGVLADDMGLGKTLQALTWLAWLKETGQWNGPVLVSAPKSVVDNWVQEVGRFVPHLKVVRWDKGNVGTYQEFEGAAEGSAADILVINHAQLRLHEETLTKRKWGVVILDEAQAIKNPTSQLAQVACKLVADFRLALTGTPIENRLLDLWSILAFAMPGSLGNRTNFAKNFDNKNDALARRRLSARVRPFLMRRTKSEVAKDLPDRIEEDLRCEMEGDQARLYKAELKRAQAAMLKVKTSRELDKLRFTILTSLLRLRQICCDPRLLGIKPPKGEQSTKITSLLELVEPLMEEGHKVLVFSQFVEMLNLLREATDAQKWKSFMLTGATENRGALVNEFQTYDGSAIFYISLKAGGSGLNLTAASYVVLYDPWWNPAVENQAIDRTHRIGQTNKVIAYRLIAAETIEEKIRLLQQSKSALAADVLGEEAFGQALTLDDFRYLLAE